MTHLMNDESMNEWKDEAVYRTAPATPGLVNIFIKSASFFLFSRSWIINQPIMTKLIAIVGLQKKNVFN